jgi:hypothetical protein
MGLSWQERVRLLTLAGGALSAATCGIGGPIPCGNANPDPCICGRPDNDPEAAKECNAERACEAAGGVWISYSLSYLDGGTVPPHCETDGGAAPMSDAGRDRG